MEKRRNSDWSKWVYSKHSANQYIIRRYKTENHKRIWETKKKSEYSHLLQDQIQSYVDKLNFHYFEKQKLLLARYNFNSVYVNKSLLKEFRNYLETKANNKEHIQKLLSILNLYTFEFFLIKKNINDPNNWKRYDYEFGQFLLELKLSSDYILRIIQLTNRYINFLHNKFPEHIRLTKLECISNAVLSRRDALLKPNRKKYINEEDFKYIVENVDPKIINQIKLAYYFGLRRAEVLGLKIDDVYQDALFIERQLVSLNPTPKYDLLKTIENRQVPYWFCSAKETYNLIKNLKIIHPDSLSWQFKCEMERLNLPFQLHDLRRTFITNALRKYHYRDVQLAAGHSQIKTTELYAQDDRMILRKKYIPD